jgi:hypothetical protein
VALAAVLVSLATSGWSSRARAQPPTGPTAKPGVSINDEKALKGYTLVAPLNSTKVHLIDREGRVVKTWETGVTPGRFVPSAVGGETAVVGSAVSARAGTHFNRGSRGASSLSRPRPLPDRPGTTGDRAGFLLPVSPVGS